LCGNAALGENYAFLVGVADYDKKELNPLQFTQNDIRDFARGLLEAGYRPADIVVLHDQQTRRFMPEGAKIRQELQLLLAGLKQDDSVIVALSGHGVKFSDDADSFFCPIDARLDDRSTLLKFESLYEQLNECRARRKLLLVDACRNEPQSSLSRSRPIVKLESVTASSADAPAVPEGIVALFSCAAGQKSYEDPRLRHGVFFHQILTGLSGAADDGDRELTLDELVAFAKKKTQDYARQHLAASQTPFSKGEFSGAWTLRTLTGQATVAAGDLTGKWLAVGAGYTLEHEFHADGTSQWAMKGPDTKVLLHWSGQFGLQDGTCLFTGLAEHSGSYSKCQITWIGPDRFMSTILDSSAPLLRGATHTHVRAK
ncbi:MAG: caspase family protein, partial [Pirellulales bacterium]